MAAYHNTPYVICFIKCQDEILVIHRRADKPPMANKQNGLGGKFEPEKDRDHKDTTIREILEETENSIDLTSSKLVYTGIVSWENYSGGSVKEGGMHSYVAEITQKPFTKKQVTEGKLLWKKIPFLLDPKNRVVANNIHAFLPHLLTVFEGKDKPRVYHCHYEGLDFKSIEILELTL